MAVVAFDQISEIEAEAMTWIVKAASMIGTEYSPMAVVVVSAEAMVGIEAGIEAEAMAAILAATIVGTEAETMVGIET